MGGRLACRGLTVERPLARDDDGCLCERLAKPDERRDLGGTGHEGRTPREQREARPSGGTGSGRARIGRQQAAEPGETIIGVGDLVGREPLLRTEDRGGAERPQQRVGDVGQDDRPARRKRPQPLEVGVGDDVQPASAGAIGWAAQSVNSAPSAVSSPAPAIGRGARADAEHEPRDAVIQGGGDRLAEADGAGIPRQTAVAEQLDARRRRELDDTRAVRRLGRRGQQEPRGIRPLPVRSCHDDRHAAGARHRGGEGVQRALSPVGDGPHDEVVVRPLRGPALGERGCGIGGGDRAFEAVGCEDDRSPWRRHAVVSARVCSRAGAPRVGWRQGRTAMRRRRRHGASRSRRLRAGRARS